MQPEFKPWPKIARWSREIIVTEKLDGTNAAVVVTDDGGVYAQSRTRIIVPGDDNFGFALWVSQHVDELRELGPGYHFGEWWGVGIQRGYGLSERRFSLFNVSRWAEARPACCHVVPTLYRGPLCNTAITVAVGQLMTRGSSAATGFMKPEGIVVFHTASGAMYKKTIEDDEKPKGIQNGYSHAFKC